jgi:hypothetical protein
MYKTDKADKTVVAVTDCRPCGRPGAEAGLLYLDECASSFVQESWQATDDRLGMRLAAPGWDRITSFSGQRATPPSSINTAYVDLETWDDRFFPF